MLLLNLNSLTNQPEFMFFKKIICIYILASALLPWPDEEELETGEENRI